MTPDLARDLLEVIYGVDGALRLTDEQAVTMLRLVPRRDDSEREYSRDEAGRFASTGEASEHAREHADLAKAAAIGTNAGARNRARKAGERADLARAAHEQGDLAGATRHAVAAERHAIDAVQHSGLSEWTARERLGALRGVEAAKTSAERAEAHMHAARTFGITEAAGRKHLAEARAHQQAASAGVAADAKTAEERGEGQRIGVGLRVRGAEAETPSHEVHTIQEPSRQIRVGETKIESSTGEPDRPPPAPETPKFRPTPDREVPVREGDRKIDFGYTHQRREPQRPPPERRHFSDVDRNDPNRDKAARLVNLPDAPESKRGLLSRLLGRRDSVDYVRAWLAETFRADVADVPDQVVLARAQVILRVPRQASAGALLVSVLDAIARRGSDVV